MPSIRPETPLADVACTMNELIAEGKVRHWGTSRWSGAQLAEALGVLPELSLRPPVSNQHVYNLLNRSFEKDASAEQPRLACRSCLLPRAGRADGQVFRGGSRIFS